MLTGKTKEQFEKWVMDNRHDGLTENYWCDDDIGLVYNQRRFELYPFNMRFGVYVDFFDSIGIDIDIMKYNSQDYGNQNFDWQIIIDKDYDVQHFEITRTEARTKAIEKANEIFNSK